MYAVTCGLWILIMHRISGLAISERTSSPIFGLQGNSIHLPCDPGRAYANGVVVEWVDYVYNDEHDPQKIFVRANNSRSMITSHPNADSYAVDDNFTLTISDVKFDDAGEYICRVVEDHVTVWHTSYYLNVGTKPTCSGSVRLREGDAVSLSCQAGYSGNAHPFIQWKRDANETIDSTNDDDIGVSRRLVSLTSTARDNGRIYSCHIVFGNSSDVCSLQLSVTYGVRNIAINPAKPFFEVADTLHCSADGYPVPAISMSSNVTDIDVFDIAGLKSFRVPAAWLGSAVHVTCVANNSVNGTLHSVIAEHSFLVIEARHFEVTTQGSTSSDLLPGIRSRDGALTASSNTTAIVICAIMGAVTLILVVVAVICMRRRTTKPEEPKVMTPLMTIETDVVNGVRTDPGNNISHHSTTQV